MSLTVRFATTAFASSREKKRKKIIVLMPDAFKTIYFLEIVHYSLF